MILFFDRDVGSSVPKALLVLKFHLQYYDLHYHQQHFRMDAPDDDWMPVVGQQGWTIIGHDSQHHRMPNELSAIKQYDIGCFYLWGSEAKRWEKMRCFARAFDRIMAAEANMPKPFIYRVAQSGSLAPVTIP